MPDIAHNTNPLPMVTDEDIDAMLAEIVKVLTHVEREMMWVDVPAGAKQVKLFRRRFYARAKQRLETRAFEVVQKYVRFRRAMYPMSRAAL